MDRRGFLAAAGGLLFALKYESIKQPADATWVLLGLKAFVAAVVGALARFKFNARRTSAEKRV